MKKTNRKFFLLTGFVLLFLTLFSVLEIYAQVREVSGTVTDSETGGGLPGVTVIIKGTATGTVTDVDGNFTLTLPADSEYLVFSFVGMITREVEIGNQTTLDVQLEVDVIGVDEVVVTGYTTQRKEALTGSITTVKADQLVKSTSVNAAQRLQGHVSGVTIVNAHTPGGDAIVRVRGLGTINNNDPLYVIDGVPTKISLSMLNPNDIETVTVLKDAASAAIYGARGANGVIIITTKQGGITRAKISFDMRVGTSKASNKYDLLNTQEYGELLWLEAANEGRAPDHPLYGFGATPDIPDYILPARATEGSPEVDPERYSYEDPLYLIMRANKQGTDWYDEMFRTAPVMEYNLGISGGNNITSYAFSGGYMKEEGILKHTGFERYSFRANTKSKIKKWFEVGQTLYVSYTERQGQGGNDANNHEASVISQGYRMQPIIPVYDIMGNFAGTRAPGTGNGANPVAWLVRDQNDYGRDIWTTGNFYAQFNIIEGLYFKSLLGFGYNAGAWKDIRIKDPEFSEAKPTDRLNQGSNNGFQWNWTNTINYNRTFADVHNLNLLAGTEAVKSSYRDFEASRTTFFSTDPNYMYLDAGEADQQNNGLGYDWTLFSYFGRLDYDYAGKYLLQATIRRDGSSRFGINDRWGTFPAFSAGWRISREDFMSGTQGWMDYLKLRVGWGQTGNNEIGNYNSFTTFRSSNIHSYYSLTGSDNTTNAGFDSNAYGNPDAKWETTVTTNFGIDATFMGKLSFTFDYWLRKTSDMLYALAIPDVVGQATRPSVNIGDMKNRGFDIELSYRGVSGSGDFTYDIALNVSHYKNEIVKISDNIEEEIFGGDFRQVSYTRATLGTSFPEFYGYIVDGIFQTQAEADAHPAFGTYNKPGHFKYRDVDGNGVIDADDRTYIGSPHPDFTSGLMVDLGYKGFDLSAFFYASVGNEMANYVRRWIDYTQFQGNRSLDRLYSSWGSPYLAENSLAKLPMADTDFGSQEPSTHFIEDASFLRMKHLQLGYSFQQNILNSIGFDKLRVYVQFTNLFTITKYSGLDPEVYTWGDLDDRMSGINMGIDSGAWPTPKQFMFGVSVGF